MSTKSSCRCRLPSAAATAAANSAACTCTTRPPLTLHRKEFWALSSTALFSTKATGEQGSSKKNQSNQAVAKKQKKEPNTGGLRRLPVVKAPAELMSKARREAERVKADM